MWQEAPVPPMRAGDVHIWLARLDPAESSVLQLQALLSDDELQRAAPFRFERDRRRFVAARGLLRSLLGRYLKRQPQAIRFLYQPAGKPYLAFEENEPKLQFNISHSNEMALIGLALEHRIGVDIEFKNPDRATLDVARHFFAPEEVSSLDQMPVEAKCDGFFAVWTRKEAYIKGRGEGIALGLDTFAVTAAAADPRLLRSSHGADEARRWRFWNIDAGPAYAAAITVEGAGDRHLSIWNEIPGDSWQ